MQSGLHQLDGKRIQGAWQRPLAKVLQHLVGRCDSVDLAVLRELAGYARRNQHELRQLATGSGLPPKTPGIHDQFPVAATLLALARSGHESPGLDLLASILINASLEQRYSKLVVRLGEMIRGACEDINNPLRLIIANAANVLELVSRVDDRLANHAAGLHPGFEGLWRRELGNTLGRWIRDDPARMLRALQPPSLAPTIDGPELELPRDAIDADDDDAPTLDSLLTDGRYSSDEPISPRAEVSRVPPRNGVSCSQHPAAPLTVARSVDSSRRSRVVGPFPPSASPDIVPPVHHHAALCPGPLIAHRTKRPNGCAGLSPQAESHAKARPTQ